MENEVLNWESSFCTFLPFKTLSDHNCLCHGISISLWGTQDKHYTLRHAIERNIATDCEPARFFKEQWQKALIDRDYQSFGAEVERSEEEWAREWAQELLLVKDSNHSLTEIHVFVLAHVVRRPIIVYSSSLLKDVHGGDLAPIYFGGIYLPLLLEEEECSSKCPVLLAYSSAHFTALVPMEMEEEDCMVVPLAQANGQYLPIQFIDQREFPPGGAAWQALLGQYLLLTKDKAYPCIGAELISHVRCPFAANLYQHCAAEVVKQERAESETQDTLPASQRSEALDTSWHSQRSLESSGEFSGGCSPKHLSDDPNTLHPLLNTCAAPRRHSEHSKPAPLVRPSHQLSPRARCLSPTGLPPRSLSTGAWGLAAVGTNSPTAPVVGGQRWAGAKPPAGAPAPQLGRATTSPTSPTGVPHSPTVPAGGGSPKPESPSPSQIPHRSTNSPTTPTGKPPAALSPRGTVVARCASPSMRLGCRPLVIQAPGVRQPSPVAVLSSPRSPAPGPSLWPAPYVPSSPRLHTPPSPNPGANPSPAPRMGTPPDGNVTSPTTGPKQPAPVHTNRPQELLRRVTTNQKQGVLLSPRERHDSPLMPPRAKTEVLDGQWGGQTAWPPASGPVRSAREGGQRPLSTEAIPPPSPGKLLVPPQPNPRRSLDSGRMQFLDPVAL
eukprot:EG_transcript_3703